MRKTTRKRGKELQDNEQIFRYWVEIRELVNGSVRIRPLSAVARIHIPRRRNEPQRPREDVLQLKDGSTTLEAKSLDDLVAQLRQRYPDGEYERTLHRERDREAEQRRADAINNLIEILVDAVVKDIKQGRTESK
jgi:hypothetical protein